jgi:hypothetical protein
MGIAPRYAAWRAIWSTRVTGTGFLAFLEFQSSDSCDPEEFVYPVRSTDAVLFNYSSLTGSWLIGALFDCLACVTKCIPGNCLTCFLDSSKPLLSFTPSVPSPSLLPLQYFLPSLPMYSISLPFPFIYSLSLSSLTRSLF